jgi:quercetin dioxygenase-like cupin family protein
MQPVHPEDQIPQEPPAFNVAGVRIQFLAAPEQVRDDMSLMRGTVAPGVVIPLHSHPDPEIMHITGGSIEIFQSEGPDAGWSTVGAGQTAIIPSQVKHALRNMSSLPVTTLLVSKSGIYQFFRELAQPFDPNQLPAPPKPQDMQKLWIAAERHQYWMASPAENAAIGIAV